MTIYNDASVNLYVKYMSDVSLTSFTIRIPPEFWATMPWGEVYTGAMWGLWSAGDPGRFAQVTELVS